MNLQNLGSGCTTVDSGVASNTRGPALKSSQQILLLDFLYKMNTLSPFLASSKC